MDKLFGVSWGHPFRQGMTHVGEVPFCFLWHCIWRRDQTWHLSCPDPAQVLMGCLAETGRLSQTWWDIPRQGTMVRFTEAGNNGPVSEWCHFGSHWIFTWAIGYWSACGWWITVVSVGGCSPGQISKDSGRFRVAPSPQECREARLADPYQLLWLACWEFHPYVILTYVCTYNW